MKGDKNGFFRAVAQAISGSQKSHRKIRLAVVKYIENNRKMYLNVLPKGYSSISEYIKKSQMSYVTHSATEIEIQATADCFGVNIFTYSGGKWLKYSCTSTLSSSEGIYLKQCQN